MTEQVQPNDETGSTGTGSGQRVDPLTGTEGDAFPVTSPGSATPLDEDEPERVVPPSPLWAMKERRHEQLFHRFGHPDRIRECIGSGDGAVFVIDDGSRHCMIGRRVGTTRDGCTYSLVGRVPRATYEALASGAVDGQPGVPRRHRPWAQRHGRGSGAVERVRRRLLRPARGRP